MEDLLDEEASAFSMDVEWWLSLKGGKYQIWIQL
jgi:hypothetical protein